MDAFLDRIEAIRRKPHHVRRRATLATAGVFTFLVAGAWLGTAIANNAFALDGSNFAAVTAAPSLATSSNSAVQDSARVSSNNLAGAAAAVQQSQKKAHIVIVDAPQGSAATSTNTQQQTIIPY